ncbi:MAG: MarR family transcriptional regulator [Sneathiella sp.]
MTENIAPGLGELLRHLTELVDKGSQAAYQKEALTYRPRYTPVMRALDGGAQTVNQITERMNVSQGAVSQTLKLMLEDGLILKKKGEDGREVYVHLTPEGETLHQQLQPKWADLFAAIAELEAETGFPLRATLSRTIEALETTSFEDRLLQAEEQRTRS